MYLQKRLFSRLIISHIFMFSLAFAVACTSAPTDQDNGQMGEMDEEHEHVDDHEHEDEGDASVVRVPNDGAAIRILAPDEGAFFKVDDEIVVEVEVENFSLGDGSHWHIYVDGSSYVMVMGQGTEWVVRGLEPGEHELSVFLSNTDHEELEDGDHIMITVAE